MNHRKGENRPIDPATGDRIGPLFQPGYYPGYSTLEQQNYWDAATREVVLDRVYNVPPIRFFDQHEARLMEAICDHIIPQADREPSRRIPIVPHIDKRLYEDVHDGYRYENMPPDRDAFRMGLRAIEEIAFHLHRQSFLELDALSQDRLLKTIHDGKPPAGHEVWKRMAVHRFWMTLVQDCIEAYYSHPWAWDEIGYGGPAYPRGYMRLEDGKPEPWESDEQRYEWRAPETSVSDQFEPPEEIEDHLAPPGQGGTH